MKKINLIFLTSDDEINNLCESYWLINSDLEFKFKTTELVKTYNISTNKITKNVRESSNAESTEIVCQNCDSHYFYTSRSDLQEKQRSLEWYVNNWTCNICVAKKKEEERQEIEKKKEQLRKIIKENYADKQIVLNLDKITLEESVYLLSFIRFCGNEELTYASPLESTTFHDRLSPQSDFDYDILIHLYRNNIIRVHPDSPLEAFIGEGAEQFYPKKVFWLLPISQNSGDTQGLIMELEEVFRTEKFPQNWINEKLILWKKIALNECLEYLANSLTEHNLTLSPGEKTIGVLNSSLENFSVGQIYNLIWRAAKDAAAFLVRTGTFKKHAANTVVGKIQGYGERAVAEKWDIKAYRRPYNCPQSIISQVFFNTVLKIGEMGFSKTPSIEYLHNELEIDEINIVQ